MEYYPDHSIKKDLLYYIVFAIVLLLIVIAGPIMHPFYFRRRIKIGKT